MWATLLFTLVAALAAILVPGYLHLDNKISSMADKHYELAEKVAELKGASIQLEGAEEKLDKLRRLVGEICFMTGGEIDYSGLRCVERRSSEVPG